jgi:hypothetical protein
VVDDWLELFVIALLWGFSLARLAARRSSPRHRTVTFILLCIAVSSTVNQADVTGYVDRMTGVPDVSVLIKNLVVVPASAASVRLSGMLGPAPEARSPLRRLAYLVLVATAAGMTILFCLVPRDAAPGDFTNMQSASPLTVGYGLLSQASMAIGLLCAVPLFWRSGRQSASGPLRTGLRLLSIGAATAIGYVIGRMLFVVSHALRLHAIEGPVYIAVSRTVFFAAMLMIVAGAAIPTLSATRRRLIRYAALHRLRPLWNVLRAAAPEAVLGPPPTRVAELFSWGTVDLRLYRRVIEIRDIQWLLRGRVGDDVVPWARAVATAEGLDQEQTAALAEARVIHVGLASATLARRTADAPQTPPPCGVPNLDTEARTLLLTNRFFRSGRAARLTSSDQPHSAAVGTPKATDLGNRADHSASR